jgi:microcin C transport system permease protein
MNLIKNPLWKQRYKRFFHHARARYSFYGLCFIIIISFFLPLICNDKPLMIYFDHDMYFPMIKTYPETTWGGTLITPTDYRDPFVEELIFQKGWWMMPPIPFSYTTIDWNLTSPLPASPSFVHYLGTDDVGRDVLARLLWGMRFSIFFGMGITLLAAAIGIFIGALQGYLGGAVDLVTQRFVEIWGGMPLLYLMIFFASLAQPNAFYLFFILSLFKWLLLVNVVRAEVFKVRNLEYVKAAQGLGVKRFSLLMRHILPNATTAALTYLPFVMNSSITTLTSLDFLGLGLSPEAASLGELMSQGKNNLESPWLGWSAFLSISFLLSVLVFVGEGVRNALDPRCYVPPS